MNESDDLTIEEKDSLLASIDFHNRGDFDAELLKVLMATKRELSALKPKSRRAMANYAFKMADELLKETEGYPIDVVAMSVFSAGIVVGFEARDNFKEDIWIHE